MPHPTVLIEAVEGHLQVRLHRPDRRNALDEATVAALLDVLRADPAMLILLGSTDPRVFCAGADLDIADDERVRVSDLLYDCYQTMVQRPGPVVAVVEGAAVGGGAQLASAADFRIAGPDARFRWVGPGHGLAVGAWVLPGLVGRAHALDLTLTNRWVAAPEALRLGLVTAVEEQPWAAGERMAGHLLSLDPAAVARTKAIASAGLLDRLIAERDGNRQAWSGSVAGVRP